MKKFKYLAVCFFSLSLIFYPLKPSYAAGPLAGLAAGLVVDMVIDETGIFKPKTFKYEQQNSPAVPKPSTRSKITDIRVPGKGVSFKSLGRWVTIGSTLLQVYDIVSDINSERPAFNPDEVSDIHITGEYVICRASNGELRYYQIYGVAYEVCRRPPVYTGCTSNLSGVGISHYVRVGGSAQCDTGTVPLQRYGLHSTGVVVGSANDVGQYQGINTDRSAYTDKEKMAIIQTQLDEIYDIIERDGVIDEFYTDDPDTGNDHVIDIVGVDKSNPIAYGPNGEVYNITNENYTDLINQGTTIVDSGTNPDPDPDPVPNPADYIPYNRDKTAIVVEVKFPNENLPSEPDFRIPYFDPELDLPEDEDFTLFSLFKIENNEIYQAVKNIRLSFEVISGNIAQLSTGRRRSGGLREGDSYVAVNIPLSPKHNAEINLDFNSMAPFLVLFGNTSYVFMAFAVWVSVILTAVNGTTSGLYASVGKK